MKAVIMAGGQGTRLQKINRCIPKPMFLIDEKPILEYQIESLKKSGIVDITIIVGHLRNIIENYFLDGSKWNVNIDYIREEQPLGTGGALFLLKDKVSDDFLLIFGDLILDIDWNRFMNFHKKHNGLITLFGHPTAHPYDSDLIEIGKNRLVKAILLKKNKRPGYYHNLGNAGIYALSPAIVNSLKYEKKIDFDKEIVMKEVENSTVYVYQSSEYVKDMGTPDRLEIVEKDIKYGLVQKRNLKNPQKAVFIDRDGTMNRLVGFLSEPCQFELFPNVAKAVKKVNRSGYLAIVVTNQPVIARGECTFNVLDDIHKKMETLLGLEGAYLDDVFFCPHHPDKGFEGEIPELKIKCECRKPKLGLIVAAAEKYNIDLRQSWFVGDSTTDIQTGVNAGMKTILVKTGLAGLDGKFNVVPDMEAKDLLEAIEMIIASM